MVACGVFYSTHVSSRRRLGRRIRQCVRLYMAGGKGGRVRNERWRRFRHVAHLLLPCGRNWRILMSMALHRRSATAAQRRGPARYRTRGASLGLSALSTDDLIHAVHNGFSFKSLETFSSETGFAPAEVASLVGIPERTLARRKTSGRLSPDESERLLR